MVVRPNRLDQYTSSPGNRAYCYAEPAVSATAVAKTITSTHCTYSWWDGKADLAWVAAYILMRYTCPKTVTQWQNVGLWPANFPCPTLDLQLTGNHLCS